MGKNKIDWQRIARLNFNKEIFKTWCEIEIKAGRTEYYNTNILVLEQINKPILNVSREDLQNYFNNDSGKSNTKNKKLAALQAFFKYLKSTPEYGSIDLGIFPQRYSKEKNEELNSGKQLTIDEFIDLRNMIMKKKNNQKWAIMLELFYVYGFKIGDLKLFTSNTYDYKSGCFIKEGKQYKLSDTMVNLLIDNPTYVDLVANQNVHTAFQMMSQRFSRSIKWQDINEMHKMGMRCPICGEKYANDLDYWVIANRPDDVLDKKWLICCNCYERIKHNGKV